MECSDELDATTRTINKFYDRIRSHLDDIAVTEPERAKPVTEKLAKTKEEAKYGLVKEKELAIFMTAHEKQPDKPAKCDKLEANSLCKLLFSKPGFHNASSTAYLIEDLRINDRNRNSFLGGHSTYSVSKENGLAHITKCQQTMLIKLKSKDLLEEMDKSSLEQVSEAEINQLIDLDPKNGDALAVKGCAYRLKREHERAVVKLKEALEKNTNHPELVKKNLAIALYEVGFRFYQGNKFQEAFNYFGDSLKYDPTNQSALMQLDMCNQRLVMTEKRPFGIQDSYSSYNQRRK